jgi:rhodanese-related sulfurtransferase
MKRHIVIASCILVTLASLLQAHTAIGLPYTNITVETAYQMITSGAYPNLVILDVRTRAEFDAGHIRKAVLIPHTELEQRIEELAEHKNHEIIVYCFCGGRSTIACGILDSYGFSKVYNMQDGINAWIGSGYPVTTSYSTQIFFITRPNPAKIGQSIFLKGILTDQFSTPVSNETVMLFYREVCGSWHFALNLTTNAYGIFVASGKLQKAGTYEVCLYYPGSSTYETSHGLAILVVQP